jgi:hypothetical protein
LRQKTYSIETADEFVKFTEEYGLKVHPYFMELKAYEFSEKEMQIDIDFFEFLINGGQLGENEYSGSEARREYASFYNGVERFTDLEKNKMLVEISFLVEYRRELISLLKNAEIDLMRFFNKGPYDALSEKDKISFNAKFSSLGSVFNEFKTINGRYASTLILFDTLNKENGGGDVFLNIDNLSISNNSQEGFVKMLDFAKDSFKDEKELSISNDLVELYHAGTVDLKDLASGDQSYFEDWTTVIDEMKDEKDDILTLIKRYESIDLWRGHEEKHRDEASGFCIDLVMKIQKNTKNINKLKKHYFDLGFSNEELSKTILSNIEELENMNNFYIESFRSLEGFFNPPLKIKIESTPVSLQNIPDYQRRLLEKDLNFKNTTDKLFEGSFVSFFDKASKLTEWQIQLASYNLLQSKKTEKDEPGAIRELTPLQANLMIGAGPSAIYANGVKAYDEILNLANNSREDFKNERQRLIELKNLKELPELYSQFPAFLSQRNAMIDEKISLINTMLNNPESPFSLQTISNIKIEREKLSDQRETYETETTNTILTNAVIIAVATGVTCGLSSAFSVLSTKALVAIGGSKAMLGLSAKTAAYATYSLNAGIGLANVGVSAFGSTAGGIGGMYATDFFWFIKFC